MKVPRSHSSYRSARRNEARADGGFSKWRTMSYWQKANLDADLPGRSKQSTDARHIAAQVMANLQLRVGLTLPLGKAVCQALYAYYRTQKNTRVNHRILKQLAGQTR